MKFFSFLLLILLNSCGQGCIGPEDDGDWVDVEKISVYPINVNVISGNINIDLEKEDEDPLQGMSLVKGTTETEAKKNLWRALKSFSIQSEDVSFGSIFSSLVGVSNNTTNSFKELIVHKNDQLKLVVDGSIYLSGVPKKITIRTKPIETNENGFKLENNKLIYDGNPYDSSGNIKPIIIPQKISSVYVKPNEKISFIIDKAPYRRKENELLLRSISSLSNSEVTKNNNLYLLNNKDNWPLVKSNSSGNYIPLKYGHGLVVFLLPNYTDSDALSNTSQYGNQDLWACNLGPSGSFLRYTPPESGVASACSTEKYLWFSSYAFSNTTQPSSTYKMRLFHQFNFDPNLFIGSSNFLNVSDDLINNLTYYDNIENYNLTEKTNNTISSDEAGKTIITRYGPFAGFYDGENLLSPVINKSLRKENFFKDFDDNFSNIHVTFDVGGDLANCEEENCPWLNNSQSIAATGFNNNYFYKYPYFIHHYDNQKNYLPANSNDVLLGLGSSKLFSYFFQEKNPLLPKNFYKIPYRNNQSYTPIVISLSSAYKEAFNDFSIVKRNLNTKMHPYLWNENFQICTSNWKNVKWAQYDFDSYDEANNTNVPDFKNSVGDPIRGFYKINDNNDKDVAKFLIKKHASKFGGLLKQNYYENELSSEWIPEFEAHYSRQLIFVKSINTDPMNASDIGCKISINTNSGSKIHHMNMHYPMTDKMSVFYSNLKKDKAGEFFSNIKNERYLLTSGLLHQKWKLMTDDFIVFKNNKVKFSGDDQTFLSAGRYNFKQVDKCTENIAPITGSNYDNENEFTHLWEIGKELNYKYDDPNLKINKKCGNGIAFRIAPLSERYCKNGYALKCTNERINKYAKESETSERNRDLVIEESCLVDNNNAMNLISLGQCKVKETKYKIVKNISNANEINALPDLASAKNTYLSYDLNSSQVINNLIKVEESSNWSLSENIQSNECGVCIKNVNIKNIGGKKILNTILNKIKQNGYLDSSIVDKSSCLAKSEYTWITNLNILDIENGLKKEIIKNKFISEFKEFILNNNLELNLFPNFNKLEQDNIETKRILDLTNKNNQTLLSKEIDLLNEKYEEIKFNSLSSLSLCVNNINKLYNEYLELLFVDKSLNELKIEGNLKKTFKLKFQDFANNLCGSINNDQLIETKYSFKENDKYASCLDYEKNAKGGLMPINQNVLLNDDLYVNIEDSCPLGYLESGNLDIKNYDNIYYKNSSLNQNCDNGDEEISQELISSDLYYHNVNPSTLEYDSSNVGNNATSALLENADCLDLKDTYNRIAIKYYDKQNCPLKLDSWETYTSIRDYGSNPNYAGFSARKDNKYLIYRADGSYRQNHFDLLNKYVCCEKNSQKCIYADNDDFNKDCFQINQNGINQLSNQTNGWDMWDHIYDTFVILPNTSIDQTCDKFYCEMPESIFKVCGKFSIKKKKLCRKIYEGYDDEGELANYENQGTNRVSFVVPDKIDGKSFKNAVLGFYFAPHLMNDKLPSDYFKGYANFKMDTFRDMERGYSVSLGDYGILKNGENLFLYFQPLKDDMPDPDYHPDVYFNGKIHAEIAKDAKVVKFTDNIDGMGEFKMIIKKDAKVWSIILDPYELDLNGVNKYPFSDGKMIRFSSEKTTTVLNNNDYLDFNVGSYDISGKIKYTTRVSDPILSKLISQGTDFIFTDLINKIKYLLFGDWDPVKKQYNFETSLIYKIIDYITSFYLIQLLHIILVAGYAMRFGFGVLVGTQKLTVDELWKQMMKFTMVAAFTSPNLWNWYSRYIVNAALAFSQGLIEISSGAFVSKVLDFEYTSSSHVVDPGFGPSSAILNYILNFNTVNRLLAITFSSITGIFVTIFILISFVQYFINILKAMTIYVLSLLTLAIFFMMGPLVFLGLIFDETKKIFDTWWKGIASAIAQQTTMFIALAVFSTIYMNFIKGIFNFTICIEPLFKIPFVNIVPMYVWKITGTLPMEYIAYVGGKVAGNVDGGVSIFAGITLYLISMIMNKFIDSAMKIASGLFGGEDPFNQLTASAGAIFDGLKEKASASNAFGALKNRIFSGNKK